ncbi:MAG: NADH oxidase, partial [Dehalococcoidia bacterium]
MINQRLSSLFQPIAIGDMRLKNRIVMAPMGTGLTSDDGSVTEQLIEYHAERARGGVGLIVVEPVCVDYPTGALLPKGLRL